MNAESILVNVARQLQNVGLDVVMIGNSAAALQGAPVTTLDIDFMFRDTPSNLAKLKRLADKLRAVILRPYYPASRLYRVVRDRDSLQLDFMPQIHGIRSFAGLKARAHAVRFGSASLLVADLADIIKSKEKAARDQDKAVLKVLKLTLNEKEKARKS